MLPQRDPRQHATTSAIQLLANVACMPHAQVLLLWGLFMLVDAAYSGDWSRIGAISKELEAQLKGIAPLVGGFHLFCAPVAAVVASKRGLSTPKAVAKVHSEIL